MASNLVGRINMLPEDLKYSETHEWVRILAKKREATIGLTDFAIKQLSDLVHIELPKVGEALEQGTPFGEIESVKTVADLVAPVGGTITEVNHEVESDVEILKENAFEDGWLLKIKHEKPTELDALMSQKEYTDFLGTLEQDEDEAEQDGE